ncbi:MAG: class I SAM-dependent methyltransferase [Desulfobulbaceae bacterium]|jgi:SAM-dependent methyltransferase|nr:class I SAM-dependent methyltransferase [Desulfobulbaceae bacterium]
MGLDCNFETYRHYDKYVLDAVRKYAPHAQRVLELGCGQCRLANEYDPVFGCGQCHLVKKYGLSDQRVLELDYDYCCLVKKDVPSYRSVSELGCSQCCLAKKVCVELAFIEGKAREEIQGKASEGNDAKSICNTIKFYGLDREEMPDKCCGVGYEIHNGCGVKYEIHHAQFNIEGIDCFHKKFKELFNEEYECFDAIILFRVAHHLRTDKALQSLYHLLNPGGVVILFDLYNKPICSNNQEFYDLMWNKRNPEALKEEKKMMNGNEWKEHKKNEPDKFNWKKLQSIFKISGLKKKEYKQLDGIFKFFVYQKNKEYLEQRNSFRDNILRLCVLLILYFIIVSGFCQWVYLLFGGIFALSTPHTWLAFVIFMAITMVLIEWKCYRQFRVGRIGKPEDILKNPLAKRIWSTLEKMIFILFYKQDYEFPYFFALYEGYSNAVIVKDIAECNDFIKLFFRGKMGEIWIYNSDAAGFADEGAFKALYQDIFEKYANIIRIRIVMSESASGVFGQTKQDKDKNYDKQVGENVRQLGRAGDIFIEKWEDVINKCRGSGMCKDNSKCRKNSHDCRKCKKECGEKEKCGIRKIRLYVSEVDTIIFYVQNADLMRQEAVCVERHARDSGVHIMRGVYKICIAAMRSRQERYEINFHERQGKYQADPLELYMPFDVMAAFQELFAPENYPREKEGEQPPEVDERWNESLYNILRGNEKEKTPCYSKRHK